MSEFAIVVYLMDMFGLMNPMLLLAFVTILAICILLAVFKLSANKEKKRYHPATVFHLLLNFHCYHNYLTDLARKDRTFRILYPGKSNIYTTDPAVVEHILKTNFAKYGKGPVQYDILKDLLGDGIFTVDGEKWRHQSYEFSTRILREFSSGAFRTNASKLAYIVSAAVASDNTIEIQVLGTPQFIKMLSIVK